MENATTALPKGNTIIVCYSVTTFMFMLQNFRFIKLMLTSFSQVDHWFQHAILSWNGQVKGNNSHSFTELTFQGQSHLRIFVTCVTILKQLVGPPSVYTCTDYIKQKFICIGLIYSALYQYFTCVASSIMNDCMVVPGMKRLIVQLQSEFIMGTEFFFSVFPILYVYVRCKAWICTLRANPWIACSIRGSIAVCMVLLLCTRTDGKEIINVVQ